MQSCQMVCASRTVSRCGEDDPFRPSSCFFDHVLPIPIQGMRSFPFSPDIVTPLLVVHPSTIPSTQSPRHNSLDTISHRQIPSTVRLRVSHMRTVAYRTHTRRAPKKCFLVQNAKLPSPSLLLQPSVCVPFFWQDNSPPRNRDTHTLSVLLFRFGVERGSLTILSTGEKHTSLSRVLSSLPAGFWKDCVQQVLSRQERLFSVWWKGPELKTVMERAATFP